MVHLHPHGNTMEDIDWISQDFEAKKINLKRLNNAILPDPDETSAGSLVSVQNSFTAK